MQNGELNSAIPKAGILIPLSRKYLLDSGLRRNDDADHSAIHPLRLCAFAVSVF